ncbi:hypothetical protein GSI_13693 [Ganoderma sinense ZZ0214-1]|uniref:Uncharacterized protein n=1 Tax=Ganoderma sinense ZZ0214-1 TaxID=1077348 RepID=A0A2G8RR12_9APHY|nr:hypothetical protein GSI_13693 [Ganoderma sinense ZZ0214-1]
MDFEDHTRDDVDDLASIVLPVLLDRVKADVDAIEERTRARPLPVNDLEKRLRELADRVCAHVILGGTPTELVRLVERLQGIIGQTPAALALGDCFRQTYNRTRNPIRYREAVTRRATADETRCRASTLEVAYERANTTFAETTLAFRIQRLVEAAQASYYSACSAADKYAAMGGEAGPNVADSLKGERREQEHADKQARIAREIQEASARSVEGDAESGEGRSE